MKNKYLSNLKESSADIYHTFKSAGIDFWGIIGSFTAAGYGIHKENSKIIIPALAVSLVGGAYKTYKDFFSSKRKSVPEVLKKKTLEAEVV